MDGNMDGNIAIWTVTELQLSQSQSTLISRRPITGLPTARPITEHLNFAITGSGEWSAEILFIFDENVTLPEIYNSTSTKYEEVLRIRITVTDFGTGSYIVLKTNKNLY